MSSAVLENPNLVTEISKEIGSQSVVVLDVKKRFLGQKYEIWSHNGKKNTRRCPIIFSRELEALGVEEIVLNSIDHDGMMNGYDSILAGKIREPVRIPMTVLGGAGSLKDIRNLVSNFGIIGAAVGSLFIFTRNL